MADRRGPGGPAAKGLIRSHGAVWCSMRRAVAALVRAVTAVQESLRRLTPYRSAGVGADGIRPHLVDKNCVSSMGCALAAG